MFSFLIIPCLALTLWFYRERKADAWLWTALTYIGLMALCSQYYNSYAAASGWDYLIPLILRDFLTLGMVGLVQRFAVTRQIPLWQAILMMLGLYAASRMIPVPYPAGELSAITYAEDGEYLVDLNLKTTTEAELQAWAVARGFSVRRAFQMTDAGATELDEYYLLDVPAFNELTTEQLENSQLFDWVEGNEVIQLKDPITSVAQTQPNRLGVNDPDIDKQWALGALNMSAYYQLLAQQPKPAKPARLFILDTGVEGNHADIRSNYRSHQSGYDNDEHGHGTHCAGIAAATTNNGIGIASPNAQGFVEVSSIRVLSKRGVGTQQGIIQGMLEAADNGADVISMSLGGRSAASKRRSYNQAVSYARRNNCIIVAAAGNSNRPAADHLPAGAAGLITVAAVDRELQRATFSNTLQNIERPICAPGVNIYSTFPRGQYKQFSGTSMACPLVAGLIANLRALNPDLDTDSAWQILHRTGRDLNNGDLTGRLIQPAAALRELINS
ncbi:MAG: S8 family serine peptidase [Bacteroidota bacterium]